MKLLFKTRDILRELCCRTLIFWFRSLLKVEQVIFIAAQMIINTNGFVNFFV